MIPPVDDLSNVFRPRSLGCLILTLICVGGLCSNATAQLQNGELDDGTNWWYGHGGALIESVSADFYQSGNAAKVSGRTAYWNGLAQDLNGDLQVGTDYHFQCWVKLLDVPSGELRLEIQQTDDRGERSLKIGGVKASDSEWTLLEGGFQLMVNGDLDNLLFFVNGDAKDPREFDFLVDSLTITENDWRAAANARIELHRKRDVELQFRNLSGDPVSNVEIEVEQVGHHFGFGSTLNDVFTTDPVYADFFKNNFAWATIEWFAQWKAVENTQGEPDYDLADASVAFAQQNGIQLRGHALAWGDPTFIPPWIPELTDSEIQTNLEQRIEDVVSRYAGQLPHWDVNNEQLRNTFFKDRLGDAIRVQMFDAAQSADPKVKLFTNEVNVINGAAESQAYREMIQGLQAGGANVGGIGLQSHFFEGWVSPKAMEIALSKLTDLGPEIWFSEFDVVNPDVVERAKALEIFYRYAFSVPETSGIIMWGFWEATHWLDDAHLVDLDWTINEAGQQYFDLIEEWTTNVSASASSENSSLEFRGFHGNYLIKTTVKPSNVVNYHLVRVEPGTGTQNVELSLAGRAPGTLMIYGTSGDDLFEYDFSSPEMLKINGTVSPFPADTNVTTFRLDGGAGDDTLVVTGSAEFQRFVMRPERMTFIGQPFSIYHDGFESVEAVAGSNLDTVAVLDSVGDDTLNSYPDKTTMEINGSELVARNFQTVYGISTQGDDTANLFDSPETDTVSSAISNYVNVRQADKLRRITNFKESHFYSTEGEDWFSCVPSVAVRTMDLTADSASFENETNSFHFHDLAFTVIREKQANSNPIYFDSTANESDDYLNINPDRTLIYDADRLRYTIFDVKNTILTGDEADSVTFRDGEGDDSASAIADQFSLDGGPDYVHTVAGFGQVVAFSVNGGTNTITEDEPNFSLITIGDWQE
jgi:GH35 family endo-1,4-beta-xylanase